MAASRFRIALIQLCVSADKEANIQKACQYIAQATQEHAQLVCLPECFNCPYGVQYFSQYAESVPGHSSHCLSEAAKKNNIYLIGGSFPERDEDKLYNTCLAYGPDGSLLAKHRKLHLFDIDVPGKINFKESDALSPGHSLTVFDTAFCRIGLGICYDIRFALMAHIYAQKGCNLLVYPGAFNMTTGPAHWELLQRARAVDNQIYVAGVSSARDEKSSYVSWGHSSVVNPWGEVIAKGDHTEQIIYADIDTAFINEVRTNIPITKQKRNDLYKVICP